jgi:Glu-tRNA(Gln) amidotransferase subunit E-like FAD-binding protein
MDNEELPVDGVTTENATPEKVDLVDEDTNEVMQVNKAEPFDLSSVQNQKSQDDYFNALAIEMDKKKDELLKPVAIENMFSKSSLKSIDKDSVKKHLDVRISVYLQKIETIYINNPILIRVNQETVKEIEDAISKATTTEEANKLKQSRAAAMQQIEKLKNEIDPDNVGNLVEQMEKTIAQLQDYIR